MPQGLVALSKFQAGLEVTRGTAVAATRIQPLNGYFVENVERYKVHEQRNSFIDVYRSFQTRRAVELRGLTTSPTFEDVPWFLQSMAKGSVTGVLSNVTVYSYTFTPTVASDDLKTVTWECGDDTQAFQVPYGLGERFELQFQAERPGVMTCDYLGQRAIKQAFTGALTDRVTEDANGAVAKAYIDATTIGTTLVTNVLAARFQLQQNWTQLFRLDGNIYPGDAYRKVRGAMLELTVQFNNTTEWDAFVTTPAERKIRLTVDGTVIAGSSPSTTKQIAIDVYGFWDAAPLSDENGIHVARLSMNSQYDAGATQDWQILCRNALSSLP